MSILNFLFPAANGWKQFWDIAFDGLPIWLTNGPWAFLVDLSQNVIGLASIRKRWLFAVGGYLLSFIAFLPMAWMKLFEHYYFFPMALRSLFAVTLAWIAWEMAISGWSPRGLKAPSRLNPAPGSLHHP